MNREEGSASVLTMFVGNGSSGRVSLPNVVGVDEPNTAARSARKTPGYIIDTGVKSQTHNLVSYGTLLRHYCQRTP